MQDYETHIVPLLATYPDRLDATQLTQASFNAAASWVASRAFGIDDYHGMLLPTAPLSNHVSILHITTELSLILLPLHDGQHAVLCLHMAQG